MPMSSAKIKNEKKRLVIKLNEIEEKETKHVLTSS